VGRRPRNDTGESPRPVEEADVVAVHVTDRELAAHDRYAHTDVDLGRHRLVGDVDEEVVELLPVLTDPQQGDPAGVPGRATAIAEGGRTRR